MAVLYMVHGTWYMVHGTWYMVHGTWYMVHGTWYMVHVACLIHEHLNRTSEHFESFSRVMTSTEPNRVGSGQGGFMISRVESGQVRRYSQSNGSGQMIFKSHGSYPTRPDPTRPDPTRERPEYLHSTQTNLTLALSMPIP